MPCSLPGPLSMRILSADNAADIEVVRLDCKQPQLEGRLDAIMESEAIYRDTDFEPILKLFQTCLKPSGEVIQPEGFRKTSLEFFRQVSGRFDISAQKKALRSKGEAFPVILAKMRRNVSE